MTHNSCTSVHHYLCTWKTHCVVFFIASIWLLSLSVSTIALEIPLILCMPHGGEGGLSTVQYMMCNTWYFTVTGNWQVLHSLQSIHYILTQLRGCTHSHANDTYVYLTWTNHSVTRYLKCTLLHWMQSSTTVYAYSPSGHIHAVYCIHNYVHICEPGRLHSLVIA